jgi:hypothetical protein
MSSDDDQGSVLYSDPYTDSDRDRGGGTRSGGRRSSGGLWGGRFSGGSGAGAGPPAGRRPPPSTSSDGRSVSSDALTDPLDDFLARYTCDVVPDVVVGKLKKR